MPDTLSSLDENYEGWDAGLWLVVGHRHVVICSQEGGVYLWRGDVRKLVKELEVKEKYQIEITNRFAALENWNVDEDVNRVWENIKENIKTAAKENLGLH